jgi:hypothetical protein
MTRDQNIPNDWDGDWACYLIEWPASPQWRAIFSSFIRSLTIGWNWDESSGSVVNAQAVGREVWDRYLALSGGNDVGCNFNELVQAILDLQGQAGACCETIAGSAGAGGQEAPEETFTDNGTNYPAGFTNRTEYDNWKCGVAQLIINYWKADLEYLQNTDFLAVTAAFIAAALLTPVPGDEIIALVGLGVALAIEGTLAAVTQAVYDAVNNNEDELRCIFYDAVDAATLKGALETWFDGKLTAIQATFVGYLINYDVLNWVFSKVNQILPAADCAACGCGWEVVIGVGVIETDGSQFTIQSADDGSGQQAVKVSKTNECCPANDTVSVTGWTGTPDNGFGVYQWASPCPDATRIVTRADPVTGTWQAMNVSQVEGSGTPFTMTFTITD